MFTCGLLRSNLPLAIVISLWHHGCRWCQCGRLATDATKDKHLVGIDDDRGARSAHPTPFETDLRLRAGVHLGAGSGNRTRVFSLEGCCSTIELYPPIKVPWRSGGGSWI